jgi:uncharacterized membrane protein
MLMAHPRTRMRSGALRAMAYCGRCVPEVPYICGLGALLTIIGALILTGCYLSRTVDQATASDVNNQSFTFANGGVFHAALANASTTLCFTDNATNFTLSSAGGTATGTNRFDSCILTVATSTFTIGAGPQGGEVITLDPCDFDSDRQTLTVSNRDLTTTSMVAVACRPGSSGNVNQATVGNVNNQSFTFTSGAVFNSGLINVSTALAFTNNATQFTLTSATGTATGTNRFGSCILTVTTSTYPVGSGPQANSVLTLSPCNFDNTAKTLTVSNAGITATSAPAVLTTP